jgi:hypothetical protein
MKNVLQHEMSTASSCFMTEVVSFCGPLGCTKPQENADFTLNWLQICVTILNVISSRSMDVAFGFPGGKWVAVIVTVITTVLPW